MAPRRGGAQPQAATDNSSGYLERVHNVLYQQVAIAAEPVAHLEKTWTEQELTRRIVRYIYNAARNEELTRMDYEQVAESLIESSMGSYNASCGEKEWFFDIDLTPAYAAAVLEIIRASGRTRKANERRIHEKVVAVYEDKLDSFLLTKAMYDAVKKTFKDATVQTKVFNALCKTHKQALEDTLADIRQREALQRVEDFLRRWLEASMARAWSAIEGSEKFHKVIVDANVSKLFQNLLAPFGDDHQYSCIPTILTESIGPPPRRWNFIGKAVKAMFDKWNREANMPAAKRRKKGSGGVEAYGLTAPKEEFANGVVPKLEHEGGIEADEEEEEEHDCEQQVAEEFDETCDAVVDEVDEGVGHPECTSEEDCVGSAADPLVQHILDGKPGDIYCQRCWESFLQSNPNLDGHQL